MNMIIKGLTDEDFCQYKKPSIFIIFPYCSFKCEKDCGVRCCQNSDLANAPSMEVDINKLINRYIDNPITSAIVCGGMEPFDSWEDLKYLINNLREKVQDDVVIYTGYNKDEVAEKIEWLKSYKNIIVKFGRFIPDGKPHHDYILEIDLASDNQYAEVIS